MKIQAFVAEIFAKQYWGLFCSLFSMYFVYFQNVSIKVPTKLQNYMKFIENFGSIISKCKDLFGKSKPLQAHSLHSSQSIKLKLFINHYEQLIILYHQNQGHISIIWENPDPTPSPSHNSMHFEMQNCYEWIMSIVN